MKQTFNFKFIALVLFCINAQAYDKQSFNQELSIQAGGYSQFIADVGSGSLTIQGADVDQITVTATVHSQKYKSQSALEDAFDSKMILSLNDKGSSVILKAANKSSFLSFSSPQISIDLDIIIPRHLNLEVDDGSGHMKISDIDGFVEIDDGSGSMIIKNIGNGLKIDDGSGNMEITNINGDLHIDDGSGNSIITDIRGSVKIDDGSGFIKISDVSDDITIDDGSGSIEIKNFSGEFKLIDDGSGGVSVNGVAWHK